MLTGRKVDDCIPCEYVISKQVISRLILHSSCMLSINIPGESEKYECGAPFKFSVTQRAYLYSAMLLILRFPVKEIISLSHDKYLNRPYGISVYFHII